MGFDSAFKAETKRYFRCFGCSVQKLGKTKLYITQSTGASSLYEPNNDELQYYSFNKWFKVKEVEDIITKRLDAVFEEIDYLHLDCQASEYDVLKGGVKNMANITGIDFEANLFPYYKRQKLFPELHNFMLENKFRCLRLDTRSNDGETCELGNCVYIKEHKSIKNIEELIKNILFALLWDRKQYVEFLIRNYGFLFKDEKENLIKLLGVILIKDQEPVD